MKYYWFMRHNEYDLKEIFSRLENAGFDGVLLSYGQTGDPFTVLANSIDKDSKMEYIVAIRPYLISPQYVSEIVNSFESFAPGKIALNIVPGAIGENDKYYNGVIGKVTDNSSSEERREFLSEWLKEYKACRKDNCKIYISGHHPDFIKYSEDADTLIMNYFVFSNDNVPVPSNKEFYLSMSPVIGGYPKKTAPDNIVTTPENLSKIIGSLQDSGVAVVFFHNTYSQQIEYLMDFVAKTRIYNG